MEHENNDLDSFDLHYILEEDEELKETKFRWEWAHESLTEAESVFRSIFPDC